MSTKTRSRSPRVILFGVLAIAILVLVGAPDAAFYVRQVGRGGTNYLAVDFKNRSPRPIRYRPTATGGIVHQIDWIRDSNVSNSYEYQRAGLSSLSEVRAFDSLGEDFFAVPDGADTVRISADYEVPTWTALILKPFRGFDSFGLCDWIIGKTGVKRDVVKSAVFSIGDLGKERDQKPTAGASR